MIKCYTVLYNVVVLQFMIMREANNCSINSLANKENYISPSIAQYRRVYLKEYIFSDKRVRQTMASNDEMHT